MKLITSFVCICFMLLFLGGCTLLNPGVDLNLPPQTRIAVLPFTNNTDTPDADQRARDMVAAILHNKGLQEVYIYPTNTNCNQLLSCANKSLNFGRIKPWANSRLITLGITGDVNEWRYKVGLDGEPAASLVLRIIDIQTQKVVWTSVGSKIGTSRDSLGIVSQGLINQMLRSISVDPKP